MSDHVIQIVAVIFGLISIVVAIEVVFEWNKESREIN